MTEYFGMPEATTQTFRGGWFRTRDFVRRDEAGNINLVSCAAEAIRRRLENIAAGDFEHRVAAQRYVLEAAGDESGELSGDEIRVFVVAQPGRTVEVADLAERCRHTRPRHMVPPLCRPRCRAPQDRHREGRAGGTG